MNNLVEFPVTGLIVNTNKKSIDINFIGQVESAYSAMSEIYKKMKMGKIEFWIDYFFDSEKPRTAHGLLRGTETNGNFEIYYFVKKQKTIQDYLFCAGHEEGHAIDLTHHQIDFEEALSKYASIDTASIENREVFANLVGLYVLAKENHKFFSLSDNFLRNPYVEEAICLFGKSRIEKLFQDYSKRIQ